MKKAMVLIDFGDLGFEDLLRKYKQAGFDGVEIVLNEERGWLNLNSSDQEIIQLREAAQRTGIEIHSVMAGLLWKYPLSSPDEKTREKGMETVEKALKSAALLGAAAVLVVPGVVTEDVSYEDAYARSREAIEKLAEVAGKERVYLAVENVWNKFLLSPLEMRKYVDDFGSEFVGTYFDVGNIVIYGYPEHWIRTLGQRIKKVHLKDYKVGTGFTYLLQGDVNWPKVRAALEEVSYEDYLTAELSLYRHYPERMLAETANNIGEIISSGKAQ